jgi:hypothetical protein
VPLDAEFVVELDDADDELEAELLMLDSSRTLHTNNIIVTLPTKR